MTHSASIAYYAMLSFFPFLLLVVSVLGAFTASEAAREATLEFVLQYFPAKLEFVSDQITALQRTQVPLGVVGGIALIWASLGFFSAISTAVNAAWRVERQRSYLTHKLVAFLMLAAACGLLALTLVVFSASQVVGASWFATVASTVSVADDAAQLRRELGGDLRADPGRRASSSTSCRTRRCGFGMSGSARC